MRVKSNKSGVFVEPFLSPWGCGYRAVNYKRGEVLAVLYSEAIPPGSPAAWLDKARLNAIRHADAAKVNPEK